MAYEVTEALAPLPQCLIVTNLLWFHNLEEVTDPSNFR